MRNSVDAALFLMFTHVGTLPLLRLHYINCSPCLRAWLGLPTWLSPLALVTLGITLLLSSLNRIEQRRDPGYFLRVSRSDILRLDAIRSLEVDVGSGLVATLADARLVDVSRRQVQLLRMRMGSFGWIYSATICGSIRSSSIRDIGKNAPWQRGSHQRDSAIPG